MTDLELGMKRSIIKGGRSHASADQMASSDVGKYKQVSKLPTVRQQYSAEAAWAGHMQ